MDASVTSSSMIVCCVPARRALLAYDGNALGARAGALAACDGNALGACAGAFAAGGDEPKAELAITNLLTCPARGLAFDGAGASAGAAGRGPRGCAACAPVAMRGA
jgi:hypothetical protein